MYLVPSPPQAAAKKAKMDRDDEERTQQMLQQQIERAMSHKKEGVSHLAVDREGGDGGGGARGH